MSFDLGDDAMEALVQLAVQVVSLRQAPERLELTGVTVRMVVEIDGQIGPAAGGTWVPLRAVRHQGQ